jgi:hypothetical protein
MASPPEDLLRNRLRPIEILAKVERRRKPPQDDRLSEDLARALNESTDERKADGLGSVSALVPTSKVVAGCIFRMDLPLNRLKFNENDGFHGFPRENSNGLENRCAL